MKKVILTLVGIGMFAMQLMAYSHDTEATFTASEDRMIRVIMDGRVMNRVPQRHVRIRDIRPGEHQVQLQVFGRSGRRALVTDHVYLRRGYKSKFRLQRYRRNRLKLYQAGIQPIDYRNRDNYYGNKGKGKNKGKYYGKHKGNGYGQHQHEDQGYSCGTNEQYKYHRRQESRHYGYDRRREGDHRGYDY